MKPVHPLCLLIASLCIAHGEQKPDIAFLTQAEAQVAIVDESVEPYFSLLQAQEMAAKTGSVIPGATIAEKRDACRKRYQAAVKEFSAVEKKALTDAINQVNPLLAKSYPLFANEPWRFIKLDSAFEGGMPHTRGHCIVLSDAVLQMFLARGGNGINESVPLLVHEQTHVVQRLHPEPFAILYTKLWNFVRMPREPAMPVDILPHQLVNPDGVACVWAFPVTLNGKKVLVEPQVILGNNSDVPQMPGDFKAIAIKTERRGDDFSYLMDADVHIQIVDLESISEYGKAFAPSEENFHPNEISAELFSQIVTLDMLGQKVKETPAMTRLRDWAKVNLAAASKGK